MHVGMSHKLFRHMHMIDGGGLWSHQKDERKKIKKRWSGVGKSDVTDWPDTPGYPPILLAYGLGFRVCEHAEDMGQSGSPNG